MKYANPVLQSDYSDPDVIRVGKDFFMVASSRNLVPGVPVLHSENLVEWRIINYALDCIPFEGFDKVKHGCGVGAPSLRYRDGIFYCLIPVSGEGVYVSETDDPYGEWSPLRPLVTAKGVKDPCPLWHNGRCYVVCALENSSKLAVFETDETLTARAWEYKIIYDGTDVAPFIGTPKFYKRNGYIYVLAAAGGKVSGWQTALRSRNIYGPYETKIIQIQGATDVNGPCRGALVDVDDGGEKWAFVHSQDMGAYGNVVHLQPAIWRGDWVICGKSNGDNLPGTPVADGEYPVDKVTGFVIEPSDEFEGERLSAVWQTPSNRDYNSFEFKRGLKLNCVYYGVNALSDAENLILQKVPYLNFSVKTKCRLNLVNDGDEVGFVVFGKEYAYICVVRRDGQNYLEIRKGTTGGETDETLCQSQPYDENYVTFQTSAKYEERNRLTYKFTFGGSAFTHKFYASQNEGTGAKIGIYARANVLSKGYGIFKFFRVVCTDNRVSKK